jgi:hypothetical protein
MSGWKCQLLASAHWSFISQSLSRGGTFFQTPAIERFRRSSGHVIVAALDYFKRHEAASNVIQETTCAHRHRERVRAFIFLIDDFVLLPLLHKKPRAFPLIKASSSSRALRLLRYISFAICIIATWQCAPVKGGRLCLGNYALSFFRWRKCHSTLIRSWSLTNFQEDLKRRWMNNLFSRDVWSECKYCIVLNRSLHDTLECTLNKLMHCQ